MGSDLFKTAYKNAYVLYQRSTLCADQKMYDAAAFYMRKCLEVIATSFIDEYERLGIAEPFRQLCAQRGHVGKKGELNPTLDDKVDFLLAQKNIPPSSEKAYDAIRKYGNSAVHEAGFKKSAKKHAQMQQLLEDELVQFFEMAKRG